MNPAYLKGGVSPRLDEGNLRWMQPASYSENAAMLAQLLTL